MLRGVAVESPEHVRDVAVDIVHEAALQCRALRPGQRDLRVHALISPALGAMPVETGKGAFAERCTPAVADQPLADIVVDRDQVPRHGRITAGPADFVSQRLRYALVGIDLEHPDAGAGIDAGMPAGPFALPGALHQIGGEQARDLFRLVGAAVEHDDDLVAEMHRLQTLGELSLFVVYHDDRGKERATVAHAALLVTRDHRLRAAASTASTDSVSISVSVVR